MSSTASSSNRNNLWWFVWQDECSVRPFVFVAPRNKTDKGKPLFHHPGRSGTAGRKFSAVKHAEVPSDSEKKVTHVKLVFMEEEDRPRAVHIDNFYVGGNSFCKNFKDSKTVQEFVDKYNTLVDASPPENNDSLSDANSCDSFIASSGTTPDTDSDSSSQEPNTKMMEDLTEDLITANKKRKRLSEVCKEPTRTEVKKPKTKENTKSRQELIMENVQAGYCGHYKLNINNLALGKQVRSTDETFLGSLVEKMRVFSDDSYNALCVIVNVSKSNFCEQNIGGYKYHVIGGQHQYLAAKQLSEESVGGAFFKTGIVLCMLDSRRKSNFGLPVSTILVVNSDTQ
ncbi:uncharacterized protein [Ptychodera flava]|uniref:uncharacterized protein n=1 Tax=Ptychodera flava TaxID=63121 RepID=UPI003969DB2A